jgi:hypothetical protein
MYSLIHQGYAASGGEFDPKEIKPIPEETKIAALALDAALQETIGRLNRGTIN